MMQFDYFCLVFLSTVSVAVLVEVKKIYVIERDLKTGQLRARRQNVPATPSHTQARVGALDHLHQHMFNLAVSPPPLQQSVPVTATLGATAGQHQQQQQRQSSDLASTVDLTAGDLQHRTPIDYLTPPPNNADIRFQNFQPTAGVSESLQQQLLQSPAHNSAAAASAAVQAPPPPLLSPFAASSQTVQFTSPFAPGGFLSAQAQPPPTASQQQQQLLQVSSPSNQVHSLSFAGQSLEQFTPYTPTLAAHEPAANHGRLQPPGQQQQQQQQNVATRWELGYDANDILTPPFSTASEQLPGGGGAAFFQQDFGPEAAGSTVRQNKQYVHGGGGGALQFFGGAGPGGFDTAASNTNNKFTPSDAVLRPSPNNNVVNNNNNNNVYWGTPKTAQQQPLRPSPTFAEPNALRFNNGGGNGLHLHHGHHVNGNNNHHVQYVDAFQMPFTGQFDGPLSQGTVAEHVVHGSFRIKRQLYDDDDDGEAAVAVDRRDDEDDGARFGDRKPVYSFVKTDKNGNFKWSVRHGY